MDEHTIARLDPRLDVATVQDLCIRAKDHSILAQGHPPLQRHALTLMQAAAPSCPSEDVFSFGLRSDDGHLDAIVTCLRNFYSTGKWYIGLLLLDAVKRGAGLGRALTAHVVSLSREQSAHCMRVAVPAANPRSRRFWERQGFVLERTVAGDPLGDEYTRHVLNLNWKE